MPGVHVREAPGYSGWTRLSTGAYKTYVPEEIRELEAALKADKAECPGCTPDNIVRHCTSSVLVGANGKSEGYTYHCRSFSRWFNPATRKMEGHAHCTCDYCF